MDRCFYRPMEAQGVVGGGERWDTEPRVGRVGLLAVAVRGVGGARRADWDVGMFRWAGRGGPLAQRCPGKTAGAARDRSVVELVGQGLVEHEVGDELDLGGIEGGRLIQEVSLGWAIPVYERGVLYAALLGGGLAVVESAEVRNAIATWKLALDRTAGFEAEEPLHVREVWQRGSPSTSVTKMLPGFRSLWMTPF